MGHPDDVNRFIPCDGTISEGVPFARTFSFFVFWQPDGMTSGGVSEAAPVWRKRALACACSSRSLLHAVPITALGVVRHCLVRHIQPLHRLEATLSCQSCVLAVLRTASGIPILRL